MASSKHFLRRVAHREIKTYAFVSEVLECGHRKDVQPEADPLTAKLRHCEQCAKAVLEPPKKQPAYAPRIPAWRRDNAA
jgi:hypothetical protein